MNFARVEAGELSARKWGKGLRGAGDTLGVAVITFIFAHLIFLPLSMFLAFVVGWGAAGAWIGATVCIIGLSGVIYTRFRRGRWREIRISSQEAEATPIS